METDPHSDDKQSILHNNSATYNFRWMIDKQAALAQGVSKISEEHKGGELKTL